jgi:antagonist of mitotic exit network protein 1
LPTIAFLSLVAKQCTRLKILDLRACELVSDVGLTKIARACRQLQYLNVGRVGNAHCITDRSVFEIARSTQIETLGVAGCQVGDDGISAISEYRGHAIERLSLNACESITDWSVSKLLLNSPKLQVLELFRCPRVMDATAILNFQRKSQALVEVDDALKAEMQEILRIRALRRRTMPELGGAHNRKGRRISTF